MKTALTIARSMLAVILFAPALAPTFATATDAIPPCIARGKPIPVNNAQVLNWKTSTPNQFKARAHIEGTIQALYLDRNGHEHFSIQIGNSPNDAIEVIYNVSFGALPRLAIGMQVEACGDYITSTAQSGPYPPSPVGAIIHWVHFNPSPRGHESGFLVIDGRLYGQNPTGSGDLRALWY